MDAMHGPFGPIDWALLLRAVAGSVVGGLGSYYAIAALLHFLYDRRRDRAAEWKCQPGRFLTRQQERQQLLLGSGNLFAGSVASGLFVYYVAKGGYTTLYFDHARHGWTTTVLTGVAYFLGTDLVLYWAHRTLHVPALFRAIHRHHHRYVSPTSITAMAMHPLEFAIYQGTMLVPLFFLPVHVGAVIATLVYSHYYAQMDHSGVRMRAWVPWQPPTQFHDDHHALFHVNYGQNSALWDRLFGTLRREGRVYGAQVFGGKGAPVGKEDGPPRYFDYAKLWNADPAEPTAERGAAKGRAS